MSGLRVLQVTDTHHPATNGVVRAIDTSRVALERLGVHVAIIAPGTRALPPLPQLRRVPSLETSVYPGLHLAVRPVTPAMVRGFDVVHVHTPGPLGLSALWAASRAGVPAVYTYHTRFDDLVRQGIRRPGIQRALLRGLDRLDRAIAARTRAIVAPTSPIATELADRLEARIASIPSGVDLDQFRPMARTRPQAPTFLTLGRLAREKDVEAILRAFPLVLAALPAARLRIAGSGPDAPRLRNIVRELGLSANVEWLGFVPEDDLARTYAQADVFVSASRFETQGLTVLEAMACGAAVALADCEVFAPFARSGAAALFDATRSEAIARVLLQAYDGRDELARAGLRFARRSSTEASARRLLALYAGLAATSPPELSLRA